MARRCRVTPTVSRSVVRLQYLRDRRAAAFCCTRPAAFCCTRNVGDRLVSSRSPPVDHAEEPRSLPHSSYAWIRSQNSSALLRAEIESAASMKGAEVTRLLILPCSARKRAARSPLPALQLYDGPAYQSLRKLIAREALPVDVMIRIVSAKYGLLSPSELIRTYDKRLDPDRDRALVTATRRKLTQLASSLQPRRVMSLLGNDYRLCLPTAWTTAKHVEHASGPPGQRVRHMLDWLESEGSCSS